MHKLTCDDPAYIWPNIIVSNLTVAEIIEALMQMGCVEPANYLHNLVAIDQHKVVERVHKPHECTFAVHSAHMRHEEAKRFAERCDHEDQSIEEYLKEIGFTPDDCKRIGTKLKQDGYGTKKLLKVGFDRELITDSTLIEWGVRTFIQRISMRQGLHGDRNTSAKPNCLIASSTEPDYQDVYMRLSAIPLEVAQALNIKFGCEVPISTKDYVSQVLITLEQQGILTENGIQRLWCFMKEKKALFKKYELAEWYKTLKNYCEPNTIVL